MNAIFFQPSKSKVKNIFYSIIFFLFSLNSFSQTGINPAAIDIVRDSFGVPHIFAKTDAAVKIKVSATHILRRYRDCAFLLAEIETMPAMNLLWQGEQEVCLPDESRLIFTQTIGQGFAFKREPNIKLRIQYRQGGERFRPD